MKVIFLDIDGVLNSTDYMNACHINFRSAVEVGIASYPIPEGFVRDKFGHIFDPRCTLYLEALINTTGAKIVISSTWRFSGIEVMRELWKSRMLPGEIIGITPVTKHDRGQEIKTWLDDHGKDVTHYVIIDDDSDMLKEQSNNFVKTDNRYGLDVHSYERAIDILTK